MGVHVANRVARSIMRGATGGRPVVTVLGVTFKENVPDIRNTRVVDIVRELEDFGITVQLHDPQADGDLLHEEYGLVADAARRAASPPTRSCLRSPIEPYREGGWKLVSGPCSSRPAASSPTFPACSTERMTPAGVTLWRL